MKCVCEHSLSDSTPYQDVRAAVEAFGRCDCAGNDHRGRTARCLRYDCMDLACDKRERFANKAWERLISEDSIIKERFQIGAIRPIRVDHTDFSKWLLKLIHFMNLNSQWST